MKAQFCILIFTFWFALNALSAEAEKFHSTADAMLIVADLLKIPVAYPEVSVMVQEERKEEGLIIEDIRWRSLDDQTPLAYIIRPASATVPLPAIICLHGTNGSRESMTTEFYGIGPRKRPDSNTSHQRMLGWARELARRGYLTLALTQRGLDIRTPDTNDQAKDLLVRGRNLMGAIVHEIRQAVSHLHQRPDVNRNKIGITGMSFGGITTFYTWLVDDRIAAAAPICGGVGSVDLFLKQGSVSYHGFYWWIPGMLLKGDQGDFAASMAPRPLMLWAPLDDIGMPKEGVDQFLEKTQPAYEQAGAPRNLVIHRPPGEHAFTPDAFEAMVQFFDQFLKRDQR
ncbi:MAG: dienelactone hydrolase family protein [bacterium]|jgi:dienelactone hydrolase